MNMFQNKLHSVLWLLNLTIFFFISCADSSCPIDFSYVDTLPWKKSSCTDSRIDTVKCCEVIKRVLAIGLATYLKNSSFFYLQNLETVSSCMSNLNKKLASMSIHTLCWNGSYSELVVNSSSCAGIATLTDWKRTVDSRELHSACNAAISALPQCYSCIQAGTRVASYLSSLTMLNQTRCFYYTCLYAAGMVSPYGPEDKRTASCMLGLVMNESKSNNHKRLFMAVFGSLGAVFGVLTAYCFIFVYQKTERERRLAALHEEYTRGVKAKVLPNTGAKWFNIGELERATNGFSEKNLIGQGGFSVLYKGTLLDGTIVAVKQLLDMDINGDDQEFTNEAEIISKIRHRNLLPLRGFCVASEANKGNRRYLVYDFMSNGSLDGHLFVAEQGDSISREPLTWPLRKNIIIDVAKGLAYLHCGIKPAIYHRDIKTTNILLDSDMRARLADFGLAKQSTEGETHLTTRVAGTYGYLAPEYALYGQLTEKSDVYSFGIIILEVMSGRKVLEASSTNSRILITDWAWDLVKSGNVDNVFDIRMGENAPKGIMERFVHVGILCAHVMVALRPTISEALKMLEGDIEVPAIPDRPIPLSHESLRYFPEFSISTLRISSTRSSIESGGRSSTEKSVGRFS